MKSFVLSLSLTLALAVAACGPDLSASDTADTISLEAAAVDNDFNWALGQPINTVVTRGAWTEVTVKRVEAPSTKYPYGKWVYVTSPSSPWLPGTRYTPQPADRAATDWRAAP